ncbi:hypothetical protein AZI87_17080 [Bdellovibrio bacteriovorus]|uniref:Type I restriction modification DNA specificity domain-containing protein n=1 Tax=Bdellovibrio bacteriovorus TaxID=959 RepID=A0A161PAL3_BDEBC|nr:restriction endonuclease subunit S [Bdellovibrio bacteriovorus]KYG62974.1 hypothetical protein AZI87_17080 [Bdellovibrio bacteriovorus]
MRFNNCEYVKINKIADLRAGYQLRDRVDPDPKGKIKFIQVGDANRETHQIDLAKSDLITIDKAIEYGKYELHGHEVLFLSKGSKPGAFTVPGVSDWVSRSCHVIPMSHFLILESDKSRTYPPYLVWALNQKFMEPAIKASMKGSGIPFIAKSDFMDIKIPIPSIEVQKKIAELSALRTNELILAKKRDGLMNQLLEALLFGQLEGDAADAADASVAKQKLLDEYEKYKDISPEDFQKELRKL